MPSSEEDFLTEEEVVDSSKITLTISAISVELGVTLQGLAQLHQEALQTACKIGGKTTQSSMGDQEQLHNQKQVLNLTQPTTQLTSWG